MKVHLKALGCRLNEAELEQWSGGFRKAGHPVTRDPEEADVLVINTCAVTAQAVRKSRKLINRLHRENPKARLVISGCHASLSPSEVAETLGVDLVVPNSDKDRLVDIALEQLDMPVMPAIATEPGESYLFGRGRQRAFVKVQDGCRFRCSYCIVTVARGEERSRAVDEIIDEINQHYAQGIREIVITGVQLGGYGNGISQTLPTLLEQVLNNTKMPRIRLGSVEPWAVDMDLIPLYANPRLMPHLHLPLQSGADTVLRRMARKTRLAEFREMVDELRARVPGFNVTTDIIVGFPGETDEEWQETMAQVRAIGFGHMHIFSYSDRQGTKSANMIDKVSVEVKKERSRQLHQLAGKMKHDMLEAQMGNIVEVLWEANPKQLASGKYRHTGYSPSFFRVGMDVEGEQDLENTRSLVKIVGMCDEETAQGVAHD